MRLPTYRLTPLLAFAALLGLSACGGELEGYPNDDLSQMYGECLQHEPTSPGKAKACDNLRRECERRRENGVYAC